VESTLLTAIENKFIRIGRLTLYHGEDDKMDEELKRLLSKPTATVPDVRRVCFGLCRNASYAAAKKGDIPTIKIGGGLFVPTAALRKQLGMEAAA
jgi:hypothetical protein